MRFDWDRKKAASNVRKHGVGFEEAATVFGDPLALYVEDEVHGERTILIGLSQMHRVLLTVFVEKLEDDNGDTIRTISARLAAAHERRRYEEGE